MQHLLPTTYKVFLHLLKTKFTSRPLSKNLDNIMQNWLNLSAIYINTHSIEIKKSDWLLISSVVKFIINNQDKKKKNIEENCLDYFIIYEVSQ